MKREEDGRREENCREGCRRGTQVERDTLLRLWISHLSPGVNPIRLHDKTEFLFVEGDERRS
jgi:hypothetical protein